MHLASLLIPLTLLLSFLFKGKKIFLLAAIACFIVLLLSMPGKKNNQDFTFSFSLFLILSSLPIIATQIKNMSFAASSKMDMELNTLRKTCSDIEEKGHSLLNAVQNLERQNTAVSDLYEITKSMSSLLHFSGIFRVFREILIKNFSFEQGFLITLRPNLSELEIGKIYKISKTDFQELEETYLPDASYYKVIEYLYSFKESAYIGRDDRLKKQFDLPSSESLAFSLLKIENKIIGALILEGLPPEDFDKFSIFSIQFSLEFKKVNLYEQIEELATTDSLTGLYVRRKFIESAREELNRAARYKMEVSFLMLDIDNFKACNDHYGHLVGDYVLKEIARIFRTNLREVDLVGRYGGEEFSVILPDTDLDEAKIVVQRILESVRNYPFRAYGEKFRMTISGGVAGFPKDGDTALKLIDAADRALYAAKNKGRDCSVFYQELTT